MNENHEQEIKDLYMEMYEKLIHYANNAIDNPALAEECVQETFRIACSKPEAFLRSVNPKGWLMCTLKNVIRNTTSSRKRLSEFLIKLYQSEEWKKDGTVDDIDIDVLYSDLAKDPDFQLIKKVAIDQKSIAEAAEELGISVAACSKRIQRAKSSLREKFLKNRE